MAAMTLLIGGLLLFVGIIGALLWYAAVDLDRPAGVSEADWRRISESHQQARQDLKARLR